MEKNKMVMLGNVSVDEMQNRTGIDFPDELIEFMDGTREHSANNVKHGQWHCFDLPFVLLCGDKGTAQKIYDQLKPFTADFKEKLQISIHT